MKIYDIEFTYLLLSRALASVLKLRKEVELCSSRPKTSYEIFKIHNREKLKVERVEDEN